jgi:hypothetical protein
MFGGAKLQSFLRLKLSLSLRQWSRDFTNLKLRVKKIKKEFLFFFFSKFFFFGISKSVIVVTVTFCGMQSGNL